jgi:RNA polymerase sigma factor (sigma-70 family)
MQEQDDAELVRRCRRGDNAAWATLVRRYQRLVYTIVGRIGLDEHGAADVFQTVFSRLFEHIARIEDPQRLQAWIVTTAKREALLQRQRARRTVSMTPLDSDEDDNPTMFDVEDDAALPEEALSDLQQLEQLRRAFTRLEGRCQGLLTLLFEDADQKPEYAVIALKLDMPVGGIGPTRARCLGKLRKLLEK